MKRLLICLMVMLPVAALAEPQTWTVYSGPITSQNITFTFDNNVLSLNNLWYTESWTESPYTYQRTIQLYGSGDWMVCGTVVDNALHLDPYATFVVDAPYLNDRPAVVGHVAWAANTPAGYQAPLLLGGSFVGSDGFPEGGGLPTMELASYRTYTLDGVNWHQPYYFSGDPFFFASNTFTATYAPVPEPASIAGLAFGLVPLGFLIRKRRK